MGVFSFGEEKNFWRKGLKRAACLDESGRGSLAGPVVAAAVMINSQFTIQNSKLKFKIQNLKDSKKLSKRQREKFYKIITQSQLVEWGIGKVSERVIDKINILEATKLAMKRALKNLNSKFEIRNSKQIRNSKFQKLRPDFLIIDGNMKLNIDIPQKSIVKADERVFSCCLASILAKVTRDRIMMRYHQKFPQYGFAQHKGYPTKYHLKMLKKHGPSVIHRKSFLPVKKFAKIKK